MFRILAITAALALLTACGDGQPFEFGQDPSVPPPTPDPDTDIAVAASVQGNVVDVNYNPTQGTVTVAIDSLDTTPVLAEYTRNAALDVPGYIAFSVQEDPLDRMFIALVSQSADGALRGGVVQDGGIRNRFFGGVFYERVGSYSAHDPSQPDNGLVSYAGTYVGMLNTGAPRPGQILPVPTGTDPALIPGQAVRVTGDVFINADFSDNSVEASVYNRNAAEINLALESLALIVTEIDADGTFEGSDVEIEGNVDVDIGDYAGVFGGLGATSIAGGIRLNGDFIPNVENEAEYGVFVLTQCGQPGDTPICDDVNPN